MNIGNDWTIVKKYDPFVIFAGAHFFPQFAENFRSHSNACTTLICSKKHAPVKCENDW